MPQVQSSSGRWLAALSAVALWSTNAYAADLALSQMALNWLLLVQFSTAGKPWARGARNGRLIGVQSCSGS